MFKWASVIKIIKIYQYQIAGSNSLLTICYFMTFYCLIQYNISKEFALLSDV